MWSSEFHPNSSNILWLEGVWLPHTKTLINWVKKVSRISMEGNHFPRHYKFMNFWIIRGPEASVRERNRWFWRMSCKRQIWPQNWAQYAPRKTKKGPNWPNSIQKLFTQLNQKRPLNPNDCEQIGWYLENQLQYAYFGLKLRLFCSLENGPNRLKSVQMSYNHIYSFNWKETLTTNFIEPICSLEIKDSFHFISEPWKNISRKFIS